MTDNILEIKNISKSFPGVNALTNVSFNIKKGSVHALLGENGAGKSTLIKVISGIYKQNEGSMIFDGNQVDFHKPKDAKKAGIAVVHQEIKLVEVLSVAENIFLGEPFLKGPFIDFKKMRNEAFKLVESLGLDMDVTQSVGKLSIAQQQIVEICKALKDNAKLVIMDEPSATLTDKEMKVLFQIIRNLKQKGISVIYISHRLEEIFEISDELTVLRDGCHISTLPVSEVNRTQLISLMVGRELADEYPKFDVPIGEVVLEAKNVTSKNRVLNASMYLRKGEILGISGLVGAGRTEFMRAVMGIDKCQTGEVIMHGKKVNFKKFKQAIDKKIGFVPEDRKRQGLVLNMNIINNIFIAHKKGVSDKPFIPKKYEHKVAQDYVKLLNIQTPDVYTETLSLSGGNQQKVVIAKWLNAQSDIFIVDEPTRGIDVGAKAEIYKLLNNLVNEGKSIIMISSEMPELIGMCDRIYVMHEGKIKGELERKDFSQERIMRIAIEQ